MTPPAAVAAHNEHGVTTKLASVVDTSSTQQQQQQQRQRQQECSADSPHLSDYELQRQQRIERNKQIMQQLGVDQAAAAVKAAMQTKKRQRTTQKKSAAANEAPAPSRRSGRLASQAPHLTAEQANAVVDKEDGNPDHAALMTQEEYFSMIGQDMPAHLESDGKFKGWVAPAVCELYGIAGSAAEAWEAHGGGKWTRKPDMSSVPAHLRAKGWSEAKAFAATMLRKNPNTYFYRHVAPHETQAQGEWTSEEHELFMATAKEHGVGDKWGLFATYIPQRVGYQCSAYYRDVVVAGGLVVDKRFRMTRCAKAVFVS